MTDRELLNRFMAERNLDYKALAKRLRFTPSYCWKVTTGEWPVTAGFQARFELAYGADASAQVFGGNGHAEPAPVEG